MYNSFFQKHCKKSKKAAVKHSGFRFFLTQMRLCYYMDFSFQIGAELVIFIIFFFLLRVLTNYLLYTE